MRLDAPRVAPIHEDNWNEKQVGVFGDQKIGGNALNIFRTLANHPDLAKRWMVFANHILFKSELPAREREIAILRIGWLCRSGYEFAQHVLIGRAAGLSDEEIERVKQGPASEAWSDHERLVLEATDELHGDAFISDGTWAGLAKTYSPQQMMDLVFTVGQYNLVSMALNSFGVQADPEIEGIWKQEAS